MTLSEPLDDLKQLWDARARGGTTDAERVDSSQRTQRMRFNLFSAFHDVQGASVLDVGCGIGDLFGHLSEAAGEVDYLGVDLAPEMITLAEKRYPDATFATRDILQWDPGRRFDYVVAIGIHNVKIEGAEKLLADVTRRQFELCEVAAHLSLLTHHFDGFGPRAMPWSPAEVLALALDITPWVTLRHDYLPHDFSITLYREPLADTRPDLIDGHNG